MVADTHDLPEPCTECMVSSVSIRLGGSAGPLAAGVGYATELVATALAPVPPSHSRQRRWQQRCWTWKEIAVRKDIINGRPAVQALSIIYFHLLSGCRTTH